jgi:N-methylhydantoinase A
MTRPSGEPFSADGGLRLAVDIGGTFTDLVLQDLAGRERLYKTGSTPHDPSEGFLEGLALVASDLGLDVRGLLARIEAIQHGTTITTNALLTQQTSPTGLVTTGGFRDVLLARQGERESQFNSKVRPPRPLVPRHLIVPVRERIDRHGEVAIALDADDVRRAAEQFRRAGVKSVAVGFLFSFHNPAHEEQAAEILAAELPDVFLSVSSRVVPAVRFYERLSTAVLNAAVGPILQEYLERLAARLDALDYRKPLFIMQSNGGVVSLKAASTRAVNTLLSGPAGAPAAASRLARDIGLKNVMTIDMGGTSFEVSLSRDGTTEVTKGGKVGGYTVATPILDISTIGAGGGSIAWVTPGGMLRVGPHSAGASPGPAAYGRGGRDATVTDANLVLGYLDPTSFNAGVTLDSGAARTAVATIAERLGIGVEAAAAGIYHAVNAEMTDSLRLATIRKGLDPRGFAMVAAGGAGPLHAAALARDLDIPLVVVPRNASVLCAGGMLLSDYVRFYVRTVFGRQDAPVTTELDATFVDLERAATAEFANEGVDPSALSFSRSADLRYVGQVHEISVPVAGTVLDDSEYEALLQRFHRLHRERFGHAQPGDPVEFINLRVLARGRTPQPLPTVAAEVEGVAAPQRYRRAWFAGAYHDVPVYAGLILPSAAVIAGPALVELPTSTIVVPEDFSLTLSSGGDYLLRLAGPDFSKHSAVDAAQSRQRELQAADGI